MLDFDQQDTHGLSDICTDFSPTNVFSSPHFNLHRRILPGDPASGQIVSGMCHTVPGAMASGVASAGNEQIIHRPSEQNHMPHAKSKSRGNNDDDDDGISRMISSCPDQSPRMLRNSSGNAPNTVDSLQVLADSCIASAEKDKAAASRMNFMPPPTSTGKLGPGSLQRHLSEQLYPDTDGELVSPSSAGCNVSLSSSLLDIAGCMLSSKKTSPASDGCSMNQEPIVMGELMSPIERVDRSQSANHSPESVSVTPLLHEISMDLSFSATINHSGSSHPKEDDQLLNTSIKRKHSQFLSPEECDADEHGISGHSQASILYENTSDAKQQLSSLSAR